MLMRGHQFIIIWAELYVAQWSFCEMIKYLYKNKCLYPGSTVSCCNCCSEMKFSPTQILAPITRRKDIFGEIFFFFFRVSKLSAMAHIWHRVANALWSAARKYWLLSRAVSRGYKITQREVRKTRELVQSEFGLAWLVADWLWLPYHQPLLGADQLFSKVSTSWRGGRLWWYVLHRRFSLNFKYLIRIKPLVFQPFFRDNL